ncbi:hypothetical protein [Staphylococcus pseudintermedius]|uniref:hypothetical protein n=1 Tax=Staphylococcus pseudintermedius TaxID=283734 RepID=UPI00286D97CE|nr:hypothetical protein [Staphylococcus pseudintermedius]WMZ54926.1 hypothetical protein QS425_11730 [Staphylococcus pseudintermedius]
MNHFAFIYFLERFIFCVGTLTRTIKDGAYNKSDRICKEHKTFSCWRCASRKTFNAKTLAHAYNDLF